MPLTLHASLIPGWLQIIGSVEGLLTKAEDWCEAGGQPESELIEARLAEDMLPFAYQVKSCWVHSALALEGARKGHFSPDMTPSPDSFAGLRDTLAAARESLANNSADDLEAIADDDMVFEIGDKYRLDFTVTNFLLGFSNPNFHFHATTAYDILRMKGLELGKRDFLGAMPIKT